MAGSQIRITTGQVDFSGGVNSDRVPTIASEQNPNGLPGNCLAWAINASMRGGGIYPRTGWKIRGVIREAGLFQEAYMYAPLTGLPYLMVQIAGRTYQVRVDLPAMITNDVTIAGDANDPTTVLNWMCQGERFLVIQDGVRLPLFWDGVFLRRSNGPAQLFGTTAANFNVPAVGGVVDVTLTAPFTGQVGQVVYINGKTYQVADTIETFTIQNNLALYVGATVFAGNIFDQGATLDVARSIAQWTVPAVGATVVVYIATSAAGLVGQFVNLRYGPANQFFVTAAAPQTAAANHVLLINVTDTPANVVNAGAQLESIAELPSGSCMDYYMGRLWLAGSEANGNGREYLAGDIVGSPATPTSGNPEYQFTDSILKITENAYLSLGGTFLVPTQAGDIRALSHPANLDTALGEGQLLALTRNTIYSVNVVPKRSDWALLSEPIQRVVQITFGSCGHRCLVQVNGDLFYQAIDGVRSLVQAIRYFQQWGNTALSSEETRATNLNDRELLIFSSGIEFDQRLLQTVIPEQTTEGVIHKGLMPLDFNPISAMGQRGQPVWEGVYQFSNPNDGGGILQILRGDYDGKQRAFGIVRSSVDHALEVWELTDDELFDTNRDGEARIRWSFETPSYTWGREFDLKVLDTMELWIDQLYGTVYFTVEFRADQSPCWYYWHHWQECAPRDACELPGAPVPCVYPTQPYKKQYRAMMTLPKPPSVCTAASGNRPINIGYSFQFRITIHGYCRVRGLVVHAFERDKSNYEGKTC